MSSCRTRLATSETKEVEMVDSVDDLKSSSSIIGIFECQNLKYSMRGLLQH